MEKLSNANINYKKVGDAVNMIKGRFYNKKYSINRTSTLYGL